MGRVFASLVMIGALAVAIPAAAAEVVFSTGGTNATPGSKTFAGNDGTNVKVTAFSIDNTGKIVTGQLGQYSGGLGIQNSGGDNSHTIDNSGWKDFLLLSFDEYVVLNNATFTTNFRYNNGNCCLTDTDATIGAAYPFRMAWNADLSGLAGQNQSVLDAMGLLTSSNTSTGSPQTRDITTVNRGGTLWLVGAAFNNPDGLKDGFKFKSVAYNLAVPPPPPVPEPSVWITMILGFGMLGGAMRRRNREALAAA